MGFKIVQETSMTSLRYVMSIALTIVTLLALTPPSRTVAQLE